jgi:hypothetical protein
MCWQGEAIMNILGAFVSGLIFGLGLVIAGMANPAKVLAFLDLAGDWDPSLALVMVGAIAVGTVAFALAKRQTASLSGAPIQLPTARQIDARLIGGSALFGVGWGLAGICPGPAVVLAGAGVAQSFIFIASMLAGMLIYHWLERPVPASHGATAAPSGRADRAG